jgi:hypothetical protein
MDDFTAKLDEIRAAIMRAKHSMFCLNAELTGLQWDIEDALAATK